MPTIPLQTADQKNAALQRANNAGVQNQAALNISNNALASANSPTPQMSIPLSGGSATIPQLGGAPSGGPSSGVAAPNTNGNLSFGQSTSGILANQNTNNPTYNSNPTTGGTVVSQQSNTNNPIYTSAGAGTGAYTQQNPDTNNPQNQQAIQAANQKLAVPGQLENGLWDPNYVPKTYDELKAATAKGLDEATLNKWTASYYKNQGYNFNPEGMTGNQQEQTNRQLADIAASKSYIEQKVENAKSVAGSKLNQTVGALNAQFGVNREGGQSEGNVLTRNQTAGEYQNQYNQDIAALEETKRQAAVASQNGQDKLAGQLSQQANQMETAMQQRAQFQETTTNQLIQTLNQDKAFANMSPQALQGLQQAMSALPPSASGAILDSLHQSNLRSVGQENIVNQFSNQKSALDNFNTLTSQGIMPSGDVIKDYAQKTGIDPWTLSQYSNQVNSVRANRDISEETRQTQLDQFKANLDMTQRGVSTEAAKKVDYYTKQIQQINQSNLPATEKAKQIQDMAQMLGIDNSQNPLYQAQLQQQQAKAAIDQITAQYAGKEPPVGTKDYWTVQSLKAQVGLSNEQLKLYGVTTPANTTVTGGTLVSKNPDPTRVINGYDFTSYAYSGNPNKPVDPSWSNGVNSTLAKIGSDTSAQGIQTWISNNYPKSPITGDMIAASAAKYGVPANILTAIMTQESSMGTNGRRAIDNFNPGNVGNVNSGANSNKGTWQDGVDALANNVARRNVNYTEQTSPSAKPEYKQYGLLADTDFNPSNGVDKYAKMYLDAYIKNGALPTARSLGISTAKGAGQMLASAETRANDLFYSATGQSLPDLGLLKTNKNLLSGNNKLLNNLNIQENTVGKNFKLAIDNIDQNGINQNSQPINNFLNGVKNMLGDPNVATYLTQNGTIQNEIGNLIAIKNASGTTVADKLASAGLVPKDASEDQQKAILKIILQEAQNGMDSVKSASGDLYKQIDPLEMLTENPNRQSKTAPKQTYGALLAPKAEEAPKDYSNHPNFNKY